MKKLLGLVLVTAMAASCVNLGGQLNVLTTMNVKKRGGFLNLQLKNVAIQPGLYRADLKINSESSFTLKLKSDKADESDILIPIKSETSFNLPSNGLIKIAGKDISQPFDVSGTIQTNVSDSEIVRTIESCTVQRSERRCEKVCVNAEVKPEERGGDHGDHRPGDHGPGPGDHGPARRPEVRCDVVCHDVIIDINGDRNVEYHNRYTARTLTIELLAVEGAEKLATMAANGTESDRINDYVGSCRIR